MAMSTKDGAHGKSEKDQSDESVVRAESQQQTDRVAMVSRTATGEAHQHPGYEVIGLPENPSEGQQAAAENRPEHG